MLMNNFGGKCTQSLTHDAHETLLDHNLLEVGGAVGEMRYLKICLQTLPLFNYQFLLTSSFAFHLFFACFPLAPVDRELGIDYLPYKSAKCCHTFSHFCHYWMLTQESIPCSYPWFIIQHSFISIVMMQLHYITLYKGMLRAQMERSSGPQIW